MRDLRQARRDGEMSRGQRSRKHATRRDEEGAESSLQGRLVASKQRLTDDEGAEELTRRDGEMRRGQRAAYMRD